MVSLPPENACLLTCGSESTEMLVGSGRPACGNWLGAEGGSWASDCLPPRQVPGLGGWGSRSEESHELLLPVCQAWVCANGAN